MTGPVNPRDGDQYRPPVSYGANPTGYGNGRGDGTPPGQPRNGFGVAALVLGILALVLSWTVLGGIVFGILALIFGLLGRGRAKRGEATNGGLSLAGVVLGIIGLLIAIGLILLINSPAGREYQQCLEQSAGDPATVQQCATQFGGQLGGRP